MNKWLQETSTQSSFGHRRKGAKWGREVNLDLVLNGPAVIVWSSESVKDPAALELEWGHAEVSGPRWSTEQWGEKVTEASTAALVPAYRSSPAPHWHQSKLMTVLLLCSVVSALRWIGSAFSLTKSLGMHTAAGSGNSNTALSWAVKEDNTSCPLWTGLVNTQIPIFCTETLPASYFTDKTFFFQSGLQWHECVLVSALLASGGISHHSCSSDKSYVIPGVTIQLTHKTAMSLHSRNNYVIYCGEWF